MSFLGWFGGGAAQKKDATKKAIIDLREQLEMLRKREKFLETQIAQQEEIARKNVNTKKTVAMAALRRKKQHETALVATQNSMATIESQIQSIETANFNAEMMRTMKEANKAMQGIHKNMNIEQVEETMDNIREHNAMAQEITTALTSLTEPQDEDELLEEFEALQKEQLDNQMLSAPGVPVSAGKVAAKKPVQEEEEDEEEMLRKLQEEMTA